MATIVRQQITRHVDAEGRRARAGTPGARKVTTESRYWYAQDVPGWPPEKRKRLATDRRVAQRMLDNLVTAAERGIACIDEEADAAAKLPLDQHVAEWLTSLRAGEVTERHVQLCAYRVRGVATALAWKRLPDLRAPEVEKHLATLRQPRKPPALPLGETFTPGRLAGLLGCARRTVRLAVRTLGLSSTPGPRNARLYARGDAGRVLEHLSQGLAWKTSNAYLATLRAFAAWCVRRHRLRADPFADLRPLDASLDPRHQRRSLSADDLSALLRAAAAGREYLGTSGTDRAWLYLLAAVTGLRLGELCGLRPASFKLDADPPGVMVARRMTKNRKRAQQALPPWCVPALRTWLADRPPQETLWRAAVSDRGVRMLRRDLAAAGIPYAVEDDEGILRFADIHALRHSCSTLLADAGIAPHLHQEIMRHADPRLTFGTYTHAGREEIGRAVGMLPVLPLPGGPAPSTPGPTEADLLHALAVLALAFLAPGGSKGGDSPPRVTPMVTPQVEIPR